MTSIRAQTGLKTIIHRASTRGVAEHGWLRSQHTFSFASYYNPERMNFGKLRVINDDIVEPGAGFGTHGHDNMEIISIPLSGALRHKDSMGNTHVIKQGEVQIMSAGTGITHSEYNDSKTEQVNFLQIWVLPKQRDIEPRYGQQAFDAANRHNRFDAVISPDKNANTIWINQDAFFSLGDFDAGKSGEYQIHQPGNGIYLFVIDGQIKVAGETLARRDAVGITESNALEFEALSDSQLLIIEVPMTL